MFFDTARESIRGEGTTVWVMVSKDSDEHSRPDITAFETESQFVGPRYNVHFVSSPDMKLLRLVRARDGIRRRFNCTSALCGYPLNAVIPTFGLLLKYRKFPTLSKPCLFDDARCEWHVLAQPSLTSEAVWSAKSVSPPSDATRLVRDMHPLRLRRLDPSSPFSLSNETPTENSFAIVALLFVEGSVNDWPTSATHEILAPLARTSSASAKLPMDAHVRFRGSAFRSRGRVLGQAFVAATPLSKPVGLNGGEGTDDADPGACFDHISRTSRLRTAFWARAS